MRAFLARLFGRAEPVLAPAHPRDAAALAAIHVASFNRGWSEQEFEQLLTDRSVVADRAASGRKPVGFVLDLRAEKNFGNRWGPGVAVFARAFNLFDARYYNGFVFNSTGSPYYSRFPEPDRVTLADPNRFYPPRRLEFGVRVGGGES